MSSVVNFYSKLPKRYGAGVNKSRDYKNYKLYHLQFPNRIAIVGCAGAGKTNIALNIILCTAYFSRVFLVVKTPEEALYQSLVDKLNEISDKVGSDGIVTVLTDVNDLPPVEDFNSNHRNLILFDDVISDSTKDLKQVEKYWVYGRKHNISTIFLSQSYFRIPKLIRDNTDVLILRGVLNKRDLKLIMSEFALDKTQDELLEMYQRCNASNSINDFMLIDRSVGQEPEYKYRHNFDQPLQ